MNQSDDVNGIDVPLINNQIRVERKEQKRPTRYVSPLMSLPWHSGQRIEHFVELRLDAIGSFHIVVGDVSDLEEVVYRLWRK